MAGSELSGPRRAAAYEIERKFLLDALPPQVTGVGPTRIRQGYLAVTDEAEVRVRERDGDRILTVKQGRGVVRREVTIPLEVDDFERLWELTAGRRVTKQRWAIPPKSHGEQEVEIDRFDGHLEGLMIAEVEFASAADSEAFEPPDWFGREVTEDDRYRNAALATRRPA